MGCCCSQSYSGPVLHVRIVEAVGLGEDTATADSLNPFCKLKLIKVFAPSDGAKIAETEVVKETANPLWNHNEKFNLTDGDLGKGSLVINICNKKGIGSDDIGVARFNCSVLKDNKEFEGWLPIRNEDNELLSSRVYIKAAHVSTNERNHVFPIKNNDKQSSNYNIKMYCLTFNCGNGNLNDLYKWIPKDSSVDMYVISHQEHYMSGGDLIKDDKKSNDDEDHRVKGGLMEKIGDALFNDAKNEASNSHQLEFIRLTLNHLNDGIKDEANQYYCVKSRKLFMIRLFVFCRLRYRSRINTIRSVQEVTGFLDLVRNKGAVGISFNIDDTSFGIIGCHLAAHQHKVEDRNKHFKQICEKHSQFSYAFHHMIWMGDLNYRINYKGNENHPKSPKKDTWKSMVSDIRKGFDNHNNYDNLLVDDQLHHSIQKNLAFYGFNEGKIRFPPTFKLARNKNLDYINERLPAWADRILFKSHGDYVRDMQLVEYNSLLNVKCSDHLPVYSIFDVNVNSHNNGCTNDNCNECHLKISEISGSNLTSVQTVMGSLTKVKDRVDGYIYVPKQLLVEKSVDVTDVIDDDKNPKWDSKNDRIKIIPFIRDNLSLLENALLRLQVRDKDFSNRDDVVGFGALSLKNFVENVNKEVEFSIPLVAQGVRTGMLNGKGTLIYH